jgi:predicted transcriptional regulator
MTIFHRLWYVNRLDSKNPSPYCWLMKPPIHPLRRWLFEHQQTVSDFAAATGLAQSHLSEIMLGKKKPSMDTVAKIKRMTDGSVTADDCLNYIEALAAE